MHLFLASKFRKCKLALGLAGAVPFCPLLYHRVTFCQALAYRILKMYSLLKLFGFIFKMIFI